MLKKESLEKDQNWMVSAALQYPPLQEYISSTGCNERNSVLDYLSEIKACHIEWVDKLLLKVTQVLTSHLYHDAQLEVADNLNLTDLAQKSRLVFVANHQSHSDYIFLAYKLLTEFNLRIYIAGGINLNIFPIGPIFRRTGCFFIRRSFRSNLPYKLALEAYIFALLLNNQHLSFFFEGGRSRTGKLLPPRYGMFHMIQRASRYLPDEKPLSFVPVSIVNEVLPESKSHARELSGSKKVKESGFQLLGLYKILSKKFGTIHLKVLDPIVVRGGDYDLKGIVQDCYLKIGTAIEITPVSILSLVMLDHPHGYMSWDEILEECGKFIDYALYFKKPCSPSLGVGNNVPSALTQALHILMEQGFIEVVDSDVIHKRLFRIVKNRRLELSYQKNTIIHHFMTPAIIYLLWNDVQKGRVSSLKDLVAHLKKEIARFKFDFCLPDTRTLIQNIKDVAAYFAHEDLNDVKHIFTWGFKTVSNVHRSLTPFIRSLKYIFEGYYLAVMALENLKGKVFTEDEFLKVAGEIFSIELAYGKIINLEESYTVPSFKNYLDYFLNEEVVYSDDHGMYINPRIDLNALSQYYGSLSEEFSLFHSNPTGAGKPVKLSMSRFEKAPI